MSLAWISQNHFTSRTPRSLQRTNYLRKLEGVLTQTFNSYFSSKNKGTHITLACLDTIGESTVRSLAEQTDRSFKTVKQDIGLFVPIFLIERGFSILSVAFFELGMFSVMIPLHYYILLWINKWGVKRTLLVSYFINILFYILLFCNNYLIANIGRIGFLFAVGLLNVIAVGLYWTAHHIYFIKSINGKEAGTKLAIISGIPTIIAIASPFLGSVLITNFNFETSFIVSAVFLFIASFVLFFSGKISSIEVNLDVGKIIDKKNMGKNIIFIILGIGNSSVGLIWPLLLFFLSVKLISMGIIYLFANLAYASAGYFGGKTSDKDGSQKIVRIGAAGHGLSMILRAFSTTIISLTAFQTMGGYSEDCFGSL